MKRSLAFAFCLAALPLAGAADAGTPQPLDVLGVRLGMPREQAVHVLLSNKPPYAVTNTTGLTVDDIGSSVWHTSLNRTSALTTDSIDLDFAPPPTASAVLRIYRSVCYNCGGTAKVNADAPSVANFLRGLADKLKSPTPSVIESRSNAGEVAVYVWTRDGVLLSSAELSRRLRYPARCTDPPTLDSARNNVGVSFAAVTASLEKNYESTCGQVARVAWFQEGGVITRFEMTLFDVSGLVSAFTKSAALLDAKAAGRHQQDLQRANQNRPNL
jgi:hypothetical protein